MATGGVLGNGTKVAYSAASPVSWTRVTQLLEVKFPVLAADKIETTVHSTSKFKRHMPGMLDVSAMELLVLQDLDETTSPTQAALWDYNQLNTTLWWRIEVPTNRAQTKFAPFEIQGYVANIEPATPIEDKQTYKIMVEFDGDSFVKYAATASSAIS